MRSSLLDHVCGQFNTDSKAALCGNGITFSYADVEACADKCGRYIYSEGLKNEAVAVFMTRSPEEVAVFLGIWKSGCYYVALDTAQPSARTLSILEKVKPRLIITDEDSEQKLQENGFEAKTVLYSQIMSEDIRSEFDKTYDDTVIEDTQTAYITFTSGSTGEPKGVITSHGAAARYLEAIGGVLGVNDDTVFGNQAPLYLDACLKDVFAGLAAHATTVLIPSEFFIMPARLVELLNEYRINTIAWVASALAYVAQLDAFEEIRPCYLHKVAFGGEKIDGHTLTYWMRANPGADFINLYGTTECTGMSTAYHVPSTFSEGDDIPIGDPLPGTELFLMGDGDEGELLVRSPSFMTGYLDDKEKTRSAFALVESGNGVCRQYYRTGDIVRRNDRGEFVFVCRNDRRIKHMGYRIELDEIEHKCNGLDGVLESVCIFNEEYGRMEIKYTGSIGEAQVKDGLLAALPRYMVPTKIVKTEMIERTGGGKIRRNG